MFIFMQKIKCSEHAGKQEINSYQKNWRKFLEDVVFELEEMRNEDRLNRKWSTWKKEQYDQKY